MPRSSHLALLVALAVPPIARAQATTDSGSFVIHHARDTVAIERFTRTATSLKGTLAIRDQKRTNQSYTAVVAPDATLPLIEVTVREGTDPYLNLSFALLEQAVQRARVSPDVSRVAFFNLGGGQTISARLSPLGADSLKLDIGNVEYRLRVDRSGRLLGGRIPAQEVVAERR